MSARMVSKDEFFAIIFEKQLDVHPYPEREKTEWLYRDRTIFGVVTPGYVDRAADGRLIPQTWEVSQ